MAIQVSKAELTRGAKLAQNLKSRLGKMKEHGEHVAEKAIRTVEMGSVAFGLGLMHGRTAKPDGTSGIEIVGMPIDLVLGAGLNLAGYFGLGGKHSDHLNNLGDGALAVYLANMGMTVGVKMAAKAGSPQQQQVSAPAPQQQLAPATGTTTSGLSQAEVREAINAARG